MVEDMHDAMLGANGFTLFVAVVAVNSCRGV